MTLHDLIWLNVWCPQHPAHGATITYRPGEDPYQAISEAMERFEEKR